MPRLRTEIASPYGRYAVPAGGLHDPVSAKTYLFADFKTPTGRPRRHILVGRATKCHLRVRDTYASSRHLQIECRPDRLPVVLDLDSTNGVFVDGVPMGDPFFLAEGMQLRLGEMHLYAVDSHGRFPITAKTVDEFMRQAAKVYGTNTLAGDRVGVSRETIRRRLLRALTGR